MTKEQIRSLTVKGTDNGTGQPAEIVVRVATLADAHSFAKSRGITVETIHAEGGSVFEPTSTGGYRCTHAEGGRPSTGGGALIALAVFVPIVGIVAGATRLGNRDASGGPLVFVGIASTVAWGLLLFAMKGR